MIASVFWDGAIAAIIGGLIAVLGTWVATLAIERRREKLALRGALAMVIEEIAENRSRLEAAGAPRLTYGVWDRCRPTIASSWSRALEPDLWRDVNNVYLLIYEARKLYDAQHETLEPGQVEVSADQLGDMHSRMKRAAEVFGKIGTGRASALSTRAHPRVTSHDPPE